LVLMQVVNNNPPISFLLLAEEDLPLGAWVLLRSSL